MIDQILAAQESYKHKYLLEDEVGNKLVVYTNIPPRTFSEHTIRFRNSKFCKTGVQPKVQKIDLSKLKPKGTSVPDTIFDAYKFLKFYEQKGFDFAAIRFQDYQQHIGKTNKFNRKKFVRV